MSAITTHVLDIALGRPAAGVPVVLERVAGTEVTEIGRARTDEDGRARSSGRRTCRRGLIAWSLIRPRTRRPAEQPFFPQVTITFTVHDQARDYHVPLLLSPFGYSTYRGS